MDETRPDKASGGLTVAYDQIPDDNKPGVRGHAADEGRQWQVSDGVLFGVFSSLLLWSLIVAGVHATLT